MLLHYGATVDAKVNSTVCLWISITNKQQVQSDSCARNPLLRLSSFVQGVTPLMMVCQKRGPDSLSIAEELLRNGADPNKKVFTVFTE